MTATSRPASRSATPRQDSTPPGQLSADSIDSLGRGFWFCPEGRTFFALSDTASAESPLCALVAELPGPFVRISPDPDASEAELMQTAKRHVESLRLSTEQRDRSFPVVLSRITSSGTWLDLETGKVISAPQQHWKEPFHGIVSIGRTQPAFVRISPECLSEQPSPQNIRNWLDAMREKAMRTVGIKPDYIDF